MDFTICKHSVFVFYFQITIAFVSFGQHAHRVVVAVVAVVAVVVVGGRQ